MLLKVNLSCRPSLKFKFVCSCGIKPTTFKPKFYKDSVTTDRTCLVIVRVLLVLTIVAPVDDRSVKNRIEVIVSAKYDRRLLKNIGLAKLVNLSTQMKSVLITQFI